jgi:hypothetical protein
VSTSHLVSLHADAVLTGAHLGRQALTRADPGGRRPRHADLRQAVTGGHAESLRQIVGSLADSRGMLPNAATQKRLCGIKVVPPA